MNHKADGLATVISKYPFLKSTASKEKKIKWPHDGFSLATAIVCH